MAWPRVGLTVSASALTGLVLLVSACGGGGDSNGNGNGGGADAPAGGGKTITLEGVPANDRGTQEVTGDTAKIELGEYYFEPTILVGAPGSTVTLELSNTGSLEHNITADIQQVEAIYPLDQDVRSGGGGASVEVTFPESGDLMFLCKYHEGDGMVGVLRAKP
jgi:plastocyanin